MQLRIDDLPAEQIRAALSIDPTELPFEEALAIEDFLDRIGGIENALLAVRMLESLESGYGL
jgi:hypothetical protein